MLVRNFDAAFAAVQQQLLATQGKMDVQGQPTPFRKRGFGPAMGRAASGSAEHVAYALVATVKRKHNHRREAVERKLAQFRNDPNALANLRESIAQAAAVRFLPISHEPRACTWNSSSQIIQAKRACTYHTGCCFLHL
jgi:hypothetical protein